MLSTLILGPVGHLFIWSWVLLYKIFQH